MQKMWFIIEKFDILSNLSYQIRKKEKQNHAIGKRCDSIEGEKSLQNF